MLLMHICCISGSYSLFLSLQQQYICDTNSWVQVGYSYCNEEVPEGDPTKRLYLDLDSSLKGKAYGVLLALAYFFIEMLSKDNNN